jgi:hypothetical protein
VKWEPWHVGDVELREFFDILGRYTFNGQRRIPLVNGFDSFRDHCEQREMAGRPIYKFRYLERNNAEDAREEAADGGLYSCFGIYTMHQTYFNVDAAAAYMDAAYYFAKAHACLELAQAKLKGTP